MIGLVFSSFQIHPNPPIFDRLYTLKNLVPLQSRKTEDGIFHFMLSLLPLVCSLFQKFHIRLEVYLLAVQQFHSHQLASFLTQLYYLAVLQLFLLIPQRHSVPISLLSSQALYSLQTTTELALCSFFQFPDVPSPVWTLFSLPLEGNFQFQIEFFVKQDTWIQFRQFLEIQEFEELIALVQANQYVLSIPFWHSLMRFAPIRDRCSTKD